MKTNAKPETVRAALATINATYQDNIKFKRFDIGRKNVTFTLTTVNSRGPGARRSALGRRIAAACWHVHGKLFEAILAIEPDARIVTCRAVITKDGGNWQDCNIGSMARPMSFSQACNC